jgi:hypothetical protein
MVNYGGLYAYKYSILTCGKDNNVIKLHITMHVTIY